MSQITSFASEPLLFLEIRAAGSACSTMRAKNSSATAPPSLRISGPC
jgi:hypothetical protein